MWGEMAQSATLSVPDSTIPAWVALLVRLAIFTFLYLGCWKLDRFLKRAGIGELDERTAEETLGQLRQRALYRWTRFVGVPIGACGGMSVGMLIGGALGDGDIRFAGGLLFGILFMDASLSFGDLLLFRGRIAAELRERSQPTAPTPAAADT
jgi:hypothetical protein